MSWRPSCRARPRSGDLLSPVAVAFGVHRRRVEEHRVAVSGPPVSVAVAAPELPPRGAPVFAPDPPDHLVPQVVAQVAEGGAGAPVLEVGGPAPAAPDSLLPGGRPTLTPAGPSSMTMIRCPLRPRAILGRGARRGGRRCPGSDGRFSAVTASGHAGCPIPGAGGVYMGEWIIQAGRDSAGRKR